MADLPPPRDGTQRYLAAIHDRLGELIDRLPAPPVPAEDDGTVELREPAARTPAGGKEGPTSDPGGDGPGPGAKAQRPARPSAKNTTRKRAAKPPKES